MAFDRIQNETERAALLVKRFGYCAAHEQWGIENPGGPALYAHHFFDGDKPCFWCGERKETVPPHHHDTIND